MTTQEKAPEIGICPEHSHDRLDVVVTHVVTVVPWVTVGRRVLAGPAGRRMPLQAIMGPLPSRPEPRKPAAGFVGNPSSLSFVGISPSLYMYLSQTFFYFFIDEHIRIIKIDLPLFFHSFIDLTTTYM